MFEVKQGIGVGDAKDPLPICSHKKKSSDWINCCRDVSYLPDYLDRVGQLGIDLGKQ
jgi:hypothetical protein